MAELMPSTASLETKLEEAQRVADSFAEKMSETHRSKPSKSTHPGSTHPRTFSALPRFPAVSVSKAKGHFESAPEKTGKQRAVAMLRTHSKFARPHLEETRACSSASESERT